MKRVFAAKKNYFMLFNSGFTIETLIVFVFLDRNACFQLYKFFPKLIGFEILRIEKTWIKSPIHIFLYTSGIFVSLNFDQIFIVFYCNAVVNICYLNFRSTDQEKRPCAFSNNFFVSSDNNYWDENSSVQITSNRNLNLNSGVLSFQGHSLLRSNFSV